MSRNLILTSVAVSVLAFGVSAFAIERPAGTQLSPVVQKPQPVKGQNPDIIKPAARSATYIMPVVVEITPVTVVVGQPATLTIKVKATDGVPVKQGDVKLYINGSLFDIGALALYVGIAAGATTGGTVAPLVTDDNGIISLPMVPAPSSGPGGLHMGANTIEAEFTGKTKADTIKYRSAKGSATLTLLSK